MAFENISEVQTFFVKGQAFTLKSFLNNADLAKKHKNASLLILRLAPKDYHRFHFPYEGVPSEITKIKGSYYSVSPYALANNFARVFCENKREFSILKTEGKGGGFVSVINFTAKLKYAWRFTD